MNKILNEFVKMNMEEKNISYQEMAEKTGVSVARITKIFDENIPMKSMEMISFCRVLGVEYKSLLEQVF